MQTANYHDGTANGPRRVRMSTFFACLAIMSVISFIIGTRSDELYRTIAPSLGLRANSDKLNLSTASEAYSLIQQNYDGSIDTSTLQDGAARGLTAALGDPHTVFFDAKDAAQFSNTLGGKVSGIGAEIGIRGGQPTILRVIDNSPAQKAGVQAGDQITKVNDTSTIDATADTTAGLIRGDAGTTVTVVVKRADAEKSFSITRASVTDPSVSSRMDGKVGVLQIRRFDDTTGDLARRNAEKLLTDGATQIILDLRDDGGGELVETGKVAGLWLDSGQIVTTVRKGDVVQQTVTASGAPILKGKPTIILVNGSTASASEIIIGALTDAKQATTLGEKTYGKGSVQQLFDLSGGREMKITIARWYTPSGKNINGNGFTPDAVVKLTKEDSDAGRDPQIDAALSKLRSA